MRIAISLLNYRPGDIGGAETYFRELIVRSAELRGDDEIVLVVTRDNRGDIMAPGIEEAVVDLSSARINRARFLEALTPYRAKPVEKAFAEIAPDVVFFPQQTMFPKIVDAPVVVCVHDIQHAIHPENIALIHRAFRNATFPYAFGRAERILAISDFTRRGLVEHYGVDHGKIGVVPLGVSDIDAEAIQPHDGMGGPYWYYPASSFPHKNHAELFEAFAVLKRDSGFGAKLALSGMRTSHWKGLDRLIEELGLRNDVVDFGFVAYSEVLRLYRGASVVVFPSKFEGFGIPVLEAVQLGKKVIVSRLEVYDEIGVPAERQIDFAYPAQLRAALAQPGPTCLERTPWTWDQTAAATLDELRGVARSRRRAVCLPPG